MSATIAKRIKSALELAGTIAMIAVAVILGWRLIFSAAPVSVATEAKKKPEPVPAELISLDGVFSKGSSSAPVTIVEYGDMQCPACVAFANDTYKTLMSNFVETGKVRFVFKHFPLPKHAMAKPAAIAAQCAGQQDRFWQFYEAAYTPDSVLSEPFFKTTASGLKLDMKRWSECTRDKATATKVQEQLDEAKALRLRATPAFLVGSTVEQMRFKTATVLYGVRPLADFANAISLVIQPTK